jgi:hypothetical protein
MESWLRPMLADPVDVVPEGDEWIIEGKLDGWRAVTHVEAGSNRVYGGRNGNVLQRQVPYIEEALRALLPPDTAVDGELIGGHERAMGDVQSIMTCGRPARPDRHDPRADLRAVRRHPARRRGPALANRGRSGARSSKRRSATRRRDEHVRLSPYARRRTSSTRRSSRSGSKAPSASARTRATSTGARAAWVKIKPQTTDEAKIVGFKPGKGRRLRRHGGRVRGRDARHGAKTTVKCGDDARHRDARPTTPSAGSAW